MVGFSEYHDPDYGPVSSQNGPGIPLLASCASSLGLVERTSIAFQLIHPDVADAAGELLVLIRAG